MRLLPYQRAERRSAPQARASPGFAGLTGVDHDTLGLAQY